MEKKKLEGKSAVVTGSGSAVGIGRAVALAMAAEGANIVVNDICRDPDGTMGADRVVEEIKKAGGTAVANYDTITTMSGGESIIRTALDNFGKIDILVNCAGNFKCIPTVDMTEDDWNSVFDVHLKGYFSCTKAAIPEMIKQKRGRIINFSSRGAFGYHPIMANLAYNTAKAGVLGFTTMLSGELKEHGITVNAIVPSAVTKLFPGDRPRYGGGPTEDPSFIAPIVAYLSTDEAQSVTGQFIYACASDLCIYDQPLKMPGPHNFIRKIGKWTIEELIEVIPQLTQ